MTLLRLLKASVWMRAEKEVVMMETSCLSCSLSCRTCSPRKFFTHLSKRSLQRFAFVYLVKTYSVVSLPNVPHENVTHPSSTRSGWKPTSQASVQRTTSAITSRPKSWGRSVGSLRRRSRTRERKKARLKASWT